MLILKQNAANSVPTPSAGKGTIFLSDLDELSVKTDSGIVISPAVASITDNTSSNVTYYPVYAITNTGSLTTAGISTTKLQFNPSTGQLTVQDLNSLSDITLKENINGIDDPFSILGKLDGVEFNWIDNKKKSYGLIAQLVEKVIPELVSENEQGKKTVNYISIIAFLIEAVKKQQTDINLLKTIVNTSHRTQGEDNVN
jgi:hypothetical protein